MLDIKVLQQLDLELNNPRYVVGHINSWSHKGRSGTVLSTVSSDVRSVTRCVGFVQVGEDTFAIVRKYYFNAYSDYGVDTDSFQLELVLRSGEIWEHPEGVSCVPFIEIPFFKGEDARTYFSIGYAEPYFALSWDIEVKRQILNGIMEIMVNDLKEGEPLVEPSLGRNIYIPEKLKQAVEDFLREDRG